MDKTKDSRQTYHTHPVQYQDESFARSQDPRYSQDGLVTHTQHEAKTKKLHKGQSQRQDKIKHPLHFLFTYKNIDLIHMPHLKG